MIKFGTVVGNISDSKDLSAANKEMDLNRKSPFQAVFQTNPQLPKVQVVKQVN